MTNPRNSWFAAPHMRYVRRHFILGKPIDPHPWTMNGPWTHRHYDHGSVAWKMEMVVREGLEYPSHPEILDMGHYRHPLINDLKNE